MEEYEQHGDQVVEDNDHIPYMSAGDRVIEGVRDSITEEIARGRRHPY